MKRILKEYLEIKGKIKAYKAREEELKILLRAMIEKNNGCYIEDDLQVVEVTETRKGGIDLDKLIASEIDPDNYRKPDIVVSKLKLI